MKVKSIESYTSKDNQARWRIHFEGDDKPLIMGTQPSFKPGDDIDKNKLSLRAKGETQYYVWAKQEAKPAKKFGKSQEELNQSARTMALAYAKDLAVAGKIAVEDIITQADKFIAWIKQSTTHG
jgi:hypothetical protein